MESIKAIIEKKVYETPFIDTHEHLIEESERLSCIEPVIPCDDWTLLLNLYFRFDLISAGIGMDETELLFSRRLEPIDKWKILKKYWPYLKNTASGIVFRNTINALYSIDEISENNINRLQSNYEQTRKKGFYKYIINDLANIRHCHVNSPVALCCESESAGLLYHDIILNDLIRVNINNKTIPNHIQPKSLGDWHLVIDWWFKQFGQKAKGVKVGNAYFRRLNFEKVQEEQAETLFLKNISSVPMSINELKMLEDHLFWYSIDKANQYNLPVKLHTGQWAMPNQMNMHWVKENPADCAALCRQSPETRFVFFHLCYPHYEEMLSLAKSFSNAYIDMCWSWSINPLAAKAFLKRFILTVPNNKIFAFGGDDVIVENIVGHATLARKGIIPALYELVNEGWINIDNAMEVAENIMFRNAELFFKERTNMKNNE